VSEATQRRVIWVLLAALVVLLYLPVIDAPFVYDDKIEVVGNGTLRDLNQWRAVATYNVSRPLLVLSYAVDYHRFALMPRGYHITNLAVMVLCVGAALLLAEGLMRLGRLERPLLRAGVAVGLWALHPMGTEAITYITGRSESLCALFSFLSLGALAQALLAERAERTGTPWRVLALLAFLAAVTSKEVGAMVPAVALGLELAFSRPGGGLGARMRAVRWLWLAPYALLIAVASWLRFQHAASFFPREVDRPLGVQLLTEAEAWLRYLGLWLLPRGQTIFHHLEDVTPLSVHGVGVAVAFALMLALGVRWGRRVPVAGFALFAGALFLLPSSSVVPLQESMAEHRAFQTGLWLSLAIVASVPARRGRVGLAVALVLAVGLSWLTHLRHGVWSSEIGLWREATQRRPQVPAAWYGLGDALRFDGQFSRAETAYQHVIELDPDALDAWNNLGITRASVGDIDGARDAWMTALRKSPSYCKAHNNLGVLAEGQHDWDRALSEYGTTLAYCPNDPRAHLGMCTLHYGPRRDVERAIYHCETFVRLAPTSDQAVRVKEWLLELTF